MNGSIPAFTARPAHRGRYSCGITGESVIIETWQPAAANTPGVVQLLLRSSNLDAFVSVGPTAHTELEGGIAGFDWETGLFLFDTKEPIERYKEEREKDRAKYKFIRKMGETTICRCPTCQVDIGELDRFCKNCGQKFHTK